MADVKITELTALASANVVTSSDVVPIVDASVPQTKKITVDNLVAPITLDKSNSRVGINTANPIRPLSVSYGVAKTDTNTAYAMSIQSNESSGQAALQFYAVGGASAAARKWQLQTTEVGVANAGEIELQPDGGKVTSKGIYFTGNFLDGNDTGISSSGDGGDLRFYSNGSLNAVLKSDGKVGIGETSPSAKLHVALDDGTMPSVVASESALVLQNNSATSDGCTLTIISGNENNSQICFGDEQDYDRGVMLYTHNDDAFTWRTSGTGEDMRLDENGRLGIGESTMDGLLVIKGDSNGDSMPSIRLKDGSDTREAWISNYSGDLVIANGGDDNVPHCKIQMYDGNVMQFSTANTERMRITADGSIKHRNGIGAEMYKSGTTSSNGTAVSFDITLNSPSSLWTSIVVELLITTIGNSHPTASSLYLVEIENHSTGGMSIATPVYLGGTGSQSITTSNPSGQIARISIAGQGGSTSNVGAYCRVVSGVTGVSTIN